MQRASDLPDDPSWLSDSELSVATGLSWEKRRGDWLLGRWTMKRAIVTLGDLSGGVPIEPLELEIPAAPDGAPEPRRDGLRIPESTSLTHRAGRAVCVLGRPGVELGCDLELLEPRSRSFASDFLTAEEARQCEEASGMDAVLLPNLLWSARESVLKALRLGLTVDTRRVRVHLGSRHDEDAWAPFEAEFRDAAGGGEHGFEGWWRRVAGCVLTVVSRPGSKVPTRLPEKAGWVPAS